MSTITGYTDRNGRAWSAVEDGFRCDDETVGLSALAVEHGPLSPIFDVPVPPQDVNRTTIQARFRYGDDGFVLVAAMTNSPMLVTRAEVEVSWGGAVGVLTRVWLAGHQVLVSGKTATAVRVDHCKIAALPERERAAIVERVNSMLTTLDGSQLDPTTGEAVTS